MTLLQHLKPHLTREWVCKVGIETLPVKMKALAFATSIVMKNGIVTVSTRSVVMESVIVTDQAERKRKDTESGGTEKKRRDVTSLLAGN